ncbi:MAG: rhodanese-related sulfurtransferase [Synechococcaceae cyanobacterium SM2_3_1]|nr:rhodanese-related sulfurtransferase [Synechococcaceae cyanobacterium SM2_3_1]
MDQQVVTFYKFISLPDYQALQNTLQDQCQCQRLTGTILLAREGINATLAGSADRVAAFLADLRQDPRFADIEVKVSTASKPAFGRLKVRLKSEIVTLGLSQVDPSQGVGTYVHPQAWNSLITDPEISLIDTRNIYEVRIGSFQGALNPETQTFREFPRFVQQHLDPAIHPKIAMFCTGGIRCEKASAYLIQQGFSEVYHLRGGILKYLEKIPAQESLWWGECFLFDERVTLQHGLELGSYDVCRGCGHPISAAEKLTPAYREGICCPYCIEHLTPTKEQRQREKQYQLHLQQQRGV